MTDRSPIPFNRPYATGRELDCIGQAISNGHLSGNGQFSERCASWLEERTGSTRALLTHSCTAALEMAALLAPIGAGDEVIMPSFTFVSTANAVVLRGGVPVFVDVRSDTLNIDESKVGDALTARTKAIFAVHYAGVACEMDALGEIAARQGVLLVEDAAQGILSTYQGRALGSLGHLAALSFHETKNVMCGEGGALLVNDERLVERAEIIHEKGTNRRKFFRGQVDKYSWVDVGSSYPLSEVNAAFLWAQLSEADAITARRLEIWSSYHEAFAGLEERGTLRRPRVPANCTHNAHMYYLLLESLEERQRVIRELTAQDVHAVFHYVPLHSAAAGLRYGRAHGDLAVTSELSDRLVRLPLWAGMTSLEVERVVSSVQQAMRARPHARSST